MLPLWEGDRPATQKEVSTSFQIALLIFLLYAHHVKHSEIVHDDAVRVLSCKKNPDEQSNNSSKHFLESNVSLTT